MIKRLLTCKHLTVFTSIIILVVLAVTIRLTIIQPTKVAEVKVIPMPTAVTIVLPTPEPMATTAYIAVTIEEQVEIAPTTEELFFKYFPEEDYDKTLDVLAKLLYGEARGVYKKSRTNCAAVIWCVLNRVDAGKRGHTPIDCATAHAQFTGYSKHNPVQDHLRELVEDVVARWLWEKEGAIEEEVGRVLPKKYIYFTGSGGWNRFRKYGSSKKFTPKHSDVYGD